MAKKKQLPIEPEEEPKDFKLDDELDEEEETELEEFMEIGGSPVPGITLRQVLQKHEDIIRKISWSPNGAYLASLSDSHPNVCIWNVKGEEFVIELNKKYSSLTWSPDTENIALCYENHIDILSTKTWKIINTIYIPHITNIAWSPDRNQLAFSSKDNNAGLIGIKGKKEFFTKAGQEKDNEKDSSLLSWAPGGNLLAIGGFDSKKINIWSITKTSENVITLSVDEGSVELAWSPNGSLLAWSGLGGSVAIWEIQSKQANKIQELEGHTNGVTSLAFIAGGKLLASKSWDRSVRLWRTDSWETVAIVPEKRFIKEEGTYYIVSGLSSNPQLPTFATLGENDKTIRIWDIDYNNLIQNARIDPSIRYTTAKLVLVGDSGVGKTGLGWRLAHNEFKEHSSTHGQQFWVVPELKKTRNDGTECEAVLWDLAGQHIYRSIHSIFLDDVDASLVLFDPTNRQEPLKGAQFWLEQLKGKKQLPPSVLVGARLDRGAPVLSQQELDQFCQKYGVSGGYIGTSAKSGEGLDKLLESIKAQIPWDQMTTTVTTVTFKRIKDYVLSLKEKTDRKGVLVHPVELRVQLQTTDKDWEFSDAEMMTAVGHLANHGYVTILKSSSGEEFILLVPERLASVASSIFLLADKHPRELGAINETELLQRKYPIEEFNGLAKEEQQVLLDATVVRFLEHSICFRETLGNDNLLIFPSLIKQKRPLKDDVPATDDVSYIVRGRVENIYASLVVLLGYTSSFTRINQWANQAQYETDKGNICGFRLVEDREGEIELILYYGNEMPEDERNDFQALFEQFLYQREVEVIPFPPVICPNGHRQERAIVVKRSQEGKKSIFCDECGAKTILPDLEAQQTIGIEASDWLKREEAIARLRSVYETHLVRVKGYRRQWATPRCYISHVEEQKEFAEGLVHDLADAGVFVIDEVSKVEPNDNIIILDSKAYKDTWDRTVFQMTPNLSNHDLLMANAKG